MKQLKPAQVAKLKSRGYQVHGIDYTMNTCYYRTTLNGETLCASVDPRLAAQATTGYAGSVVWEIKL